MPITILITGFGPFPGAPVNPTEQLARRLARVRRSALADVRLVAHVFATSYRAVEHDLPQLVAAHAPDAILMFGLAARRRALTIETRARNTVSPLLADASGLLSPQPAIDRQDPTTRQFAPWVRRLVQPIRARRLPARLSCDAGRYVCNYLCWHALGAAALPGGPLLSFVHVPAVRRHRRPLAGVRRRVFTDADLARAGEALLIAIASAARRRHSSGGNAA